MRRVVAVFVLCLALAAPVCAVGDVVQAGADVDQELVGLKTGDAVQIKDADCRPLGKSFSILRSELVSALWTCYVSDGLGRVYNVTAHVQNATGRGDVGSLDRVTVLKCWTDYSNFGCPHRPKILAKPIAAAASDRGVEQETGSLVQHQLLALKLSDGTRIRQADCRPLTSHWSIIGGDRQIFGDLWTCYVSDGLSRVYNVNVHVRNSKAGGLDRATVLSCWPTFSNFTCTAGAKIVLPGKGKGKGKG